MHHRKPTRAETPIERIYREETGRKMPPAIKRILLRSPWLEVNRRAKRDNLCLTFRTWADAASSTVRPVEDLEQIRAELLALIQRQIEALERDTFVGLTVVERSQYDARHDRIHELHAKLGQFKTAA